MNYFFRHGGTKNRGKEEEIGASGELVGGDQENRRSGLEGRMGFLSSMNRTGFASRLYEKMRKLSKKGGIGRLHPHMLRHTYLSRLYNVDHDLRFVQDQAGYASPTTTAIYAKTNVKARRRYVEALGAC